MSTATLGSDIQFPRMFLETKKKSPRSIYYYPFSSKNPMAKQVHSADILVNRTWLTCSSSKVKYTVMAN